MISLDRLYWTLFLAANMVGQSRYAFRPTRRIAADRDRAVRRIVPHAFRHVPYYRDTIRALGLGPGDFRSADDLSKLPLLDPSSLQKTPQIFCATNIDARRCMLLKTSGSSGVGRAVRVDAAALFRNAAHGERERSLMTEAIRKRHGYREAVIVLRPDVAESSTPRVQRFLRDNAYFPKGIEVDRLYIDATESPETYLPRLNGFAPDILQAYGSSLDELMDHVTATAADFHRPRVMYFHSDAVAPRTRETLAALGIPVFSTYEACEALKIGFECEVHHGYHVNIDTYPLRIVDRDGRTVPAGETGHVVVSNLSNWAMVLLNYDLGDRAKWIREPCPCGRTLPRLDLVEGSAIDSIRLPTGKTVNPSAIYQMFVGDDAIREHQLVHVSPSRIRLLLVVPRPADRGPCSARVQQALRTLFADAATTEVLFVDRIPLTDGGKKRNFVPLRTT